MRFFFSAKVCNGTSSLRFLPGEVGFTFLRLSINASHRVIAPTSELCLSISKVKQGFPPNSLVKNFVINESGPQPKLVIYNGKSRLSLAIIRAAARNFCPVFQYIFG